MVEYISIILSYLYILVDTVISLQEIFHWVKSESPFNILSKNIDLNLQAESFLYMFSTESHVPNYVTFSSCVIDDGSHVPSMIRPSVQLCLCGPFVSQDTSSSHIRQIDVNADTKYTRPGELPNNTVDNRIINHYTLIYGNALKLYYKVALTPNKIHSIKILWDMITNACLRYLLPAKILI